MFYVTNTTEFNNAIRNQDGGFVVYLVGEFVRLSLRLRYTNPVKIIASRASVKGLNISGGNIEWYGGLIEAPDGPDGIAAGGYGVGIGDCDGFRLDGATIRQCNRGVATGGGKNWTVANCDFSVRQDGIIASRGENISIINNTFKDFSPKPTRCQIGNETRYGLGRRDCEELGGKWKDGDHSDAIQLRNGMKNVLIANNRINGINQGIGQMDSSGDAPLENFIVANNEVRVTGFHSITIQRCSELHVIGNTTEQLTGRRSPLRLDPTAIVQNNEVLSP